MSNHNDIKEFEGYYQENDIFENTIESNNYYNCWETAKCYPAASAAYPSVAAVSIVDVDVSIIDDVLLEALQEFSEDNLLGDFDTAIAMPVAFEADDNNKPATVVAVALPEVYIDINNRLPEKYIQNDSECLFSDKFSALEEKIIYDSSFISCNDENFNVSSESIDKKLYRKRSIVKWLNKKQSRQQLLQKKKDLSLVITPNAKQIATKQRLRENGKFAKNRLKWIPADEFSANFY
mmetsp:Transcript_24120/g.21937  ORF Transcript_24120/g.21937 Transcript_24120/m.21937 type:complete len:236 (+) Transcript_24120:79-786(+)